MSATLQASLLCKPSFSLYSPSLSRPRVRRSSLPFPPPSLSLPFLSRAFSIPCTLQPDNVRSESPVDHNVTSTAKDSDADGVDRRIAPSEAAEPSIDGVGDGNSMAAMTFWGEGEEVRMKGGGEGLVEKEGAKWKIPILALFVGVWAMMRRGFEKLMAMTWFSWLPIWRQAKKLDRLITEADTNPKDAAKQAELLAELNKHRFPSCAQTMPDLNEKFSAQ